MRHRDMRYAPIMLAAFALALGTLGCGDDATGTSQASVTATVHDQNADAQSVALASVMPLQSSAGFTGSFTGSARIELSADGETWVELDEARQVDVQLQSSGEATTVHADVSVPLEAAAHARLVLESASANIEAGSTVGGITLDSNTTLTVGSSGDVIIEKQLEQSLDLSAESDATVSFDLNSELWVTEDNVQATAVSESEIRSAVAVQASGS